MSSVNSSEECDENKGELISTINNLDSEIIYKHFLIHTSYVSFIIGCTLAIIANRNSRKSSEELTKEKFDKVRICLNFSSHIFLILSYCTHFTVFYTFLQTSASDSLLVDEVREGGRPFSTTFCLGVLGWDLLFTMFILIHLIYNFTCDVIIPNVKKRCFTTPADDIENDSNELHNLYQTMFNPLNVKISEFKSLMSTDYAEIVNIHTGECYAIADMTKTDRLSLLIRGKMAVTRERHSNLQQQQIDESTENRGSSVELLYEIGPYEFLDPFEFQSQTPNETFHVTVYACTESVYVEWNRVRLELLFIKSPYLSHCLQALIGEDIADKLFAMNRRRRMKMDENDEGDDDNRMSSLLMRGAKHPTPYQLDDRRLRSKTPKEVREEIRREANEQSTMSWMKSGKKQEKLSNKRSFKFSTSMKEAESK